MQDIEIFLNLMLLEDKQAAIDFAHEKPLVYKETGISRGLQIMTALKSLRGICYLASSQKKRFRAVFTTR